MKPVSDAGGRLRMEESMSLLKVRYSTRYGKFTVNGAIELDTRRTFVINGPVTNLSVELVDSDLEIKISSVQVGITNIEVHAHEWEAAGWQLVGLDSFRLIVELECK